MKFLSLAMWQGGLYTEHVNDNTNANDGQSMIV